MNMRWIRSGPPASTTPATAPLRQQRSARHRGRHHDRHRLAPRRRQPRLQSPDRLLFRDLTGSPEVFGMQHDLLLGVDYEKNQTYKAYSTAARSRRPSTCTIRRMAKRRSPTAPPTATRQATCAPRCSAVPVRQGQHSSHRSMDRGAGRALSVVLPEQQQRFPEAEKCAQ